jgi:peptidylprolyl isomerase
MRWRALLAFGFLLACAGAPPAQSQAPVRSLGDILEQSPASDWRPVDPIIELAPEFAPRHVSNIRALARARYWDGAAIVRSQDNYVVQWGRDEGDTTPMGAGVAALAGEFDRPRRGVQVTRLQDPDSLACALLRHDRRRARRHRRQRQRG